MNPRTKQILFTLASGVLAVWLASQLATGHYFWPGVSGVVAIAAILIHLLRIEVDVILLGMVVFGYIVGNRGFAQLMVIPNIPLLPAEAALLVALTWRTVRCAFARTLPFTRDPIHLAILAWLIVGSARFVIDLPQYGFLAARDFAVVYYALFFFVIQHMAHDSAARRYLIGCILSGCIVIALIFPLREAFPTFFDEQLVIGSVPIFYYKADLVLSFFVSGSLLLFYSAPPRHRIWAWPLALAMFSFTLVGDVRAAILGGSVTLAMLVAARRWLFPLLQMGVVLTGVIILIGIATLSDNIWASNKLAELEAQTMSIVSFEAPTSELEPKFYKLDNNRFRLVWWKSIATEVLETNPLLGLGFGYDLAAGFLREYDQDLGDEFTARSPHCVVFTALGRLGLVGFVIWITFCGLVTMRAWKAMRHGADTVQVGLWCVTIVMLVSATFGVVLEGPMGAVIFWSALGLATAESQLSATEISPEVPEPLPNAGPSASV